MMTSEPELRLFLIWVTRNENLESETYGRAHCQNLMPEPQNNPDGILYQEPERSRSRDLACALTSDPDFRSANTGHDLRSSQCPVSIDPQYASRLQNISQAHEEKDRARENKI